MDCPNCGSEMEERVYYPITGETLLGCTQCGRTELVEDIGKPASYDDSESYSNHGLQGC